MTVQETTRSFAVTTPPADYSERLSSALDAVEHVMHEVVDSSVTVLRDASRHIIAAGGKRIRPRLVLLSYAAVGGLEPEEAAPVAAAVELVHTASVVHDDINDHGVVRRGRPSVNALWGRTFALLTGDYMFAKVYELMAPFKDLNAVLADATTALVEGETLQAYAVKESSFNRETYYRVIALKTAALFKASAEMGAALGGGTHAQIDALGRFGYNIGIAFQIVDDILDVIGDEQQLGKTAGIDIEQGRGVATAYTNEQGEADSADDKIKAIKAKALKGNALNEAREQAETFVRMAIQELSALPNTPAKTGLTNLAHSVVERTF